MPYAEIDQNNELNGYPICNRKIIMNGGVFVPIPDEFSQVSLTPVKTTTNKRKIFKWIIYGLALGVMLMLARYLWKRDIPQGDLIRLSRRLEKGDDSIREKDVKHLMDRLSRKKIDSDILETALYTRIYSWLSERNLENELLKGLETELFPWIIDDGGVTGLVKRYTQPRGVVICTGTKYFPFAANLITSIRVWNSSLPIEVFYLGQDDLKPEAIRHLNDQTFVTTVDISKIFNMTMLKLKGWDIKPFAMLASSFKETLLLDADTVPTQSIDVMFAMEEYLRTGALFFLDRVLNNRNINYAQWFRKIIPGPHGARMRNNAMYKGQTNYLQESGAVLIDKSRHLHGLLMVALLNTPLLKKEIHKHTHGDKETFWMGFEMIGEQYEWGETVAGIIGNPGLKYSEGKIGFLCGHLAHFNRQGQILWFNNGIVVDKNRDFRPKNFTHYVTQGIWMKMCMFGRELTPISPQLREKLDLIRKFWTPDPLYVSEA